VRERAECGPFARIAHRRGGGPFLFGRNAPHARARVKGEWRMANGE
jgi:hypothetical protein